MGLSIKGLLIAIAILLPNMLMLLLPPRNTPAGLRDFSLPVTILENTARLAVLALLVLSRGSFKAAKADAWLLLTAVCVLAYYALWARYAVQGREFALLFAPLWGIPVPMALFPALAFCFAAAWGRSIPLGVAAIVFSAAHILNSWHTYTQVRG